MKAYCTAEANYRQTQSRGLSAIADQASTAWFIGSLELV